MKKDLDEQSVGPGQGEAQSTTAHSHTLFGGCDILRHINGPGV